MENVLEVKNVENFFKSNLSEIKEQYPFFLFDSVEQIVKLSDYNKIASAYGIDKYELNDDEYIVLCDFKGMVTMRNQVLENGNILQIAGKEYKAKEEKEKIEEIFSSSESGLVQNLADKGINIDGMTKIAIIESSVGLSAIVTFIAIYLGIIFLIASSAILALKQLTESSDNKQRYTILRKIGCDEKMINQALFRQIGIFLDCHLF